MEKGNHQNWFLMENISSNDKKTICGEQRIKTNFEDGVIGESAEGVDEGDREDKRREVLEEVDVDPVGEGGAGET